MYEPLLAPSWKVLIIKTTHGNAVTITMRTPLRLVWRMEDSQWVQAIVQLLQNVGWSENKVVDICVGNIESRELVEIGVRFMRDFIPFKFLITTSDSHREIS